jgi:putative transcriptional regulator
MAHSKQGREIIGGLEDYLEYRQGKRSLRTTERDLPGPAPALNSKAIRRLRIEVFHLSQPLFARVLNVEVPTIRAWEQGKRQPSGAALRLLEILSREPDLVKRLKAKKAA